MSKLPSSFGSKRAWRRLLLEFLNSLTVA
jgi:hypothetical protein